MMRGLPLIFEPNLGQTDAQVQFLTRASGMISFLTDHENVMVLSRRKDKPDPRDLRETSDIEQTIVRMKLEGARTPRSFEGLERTESISNYFIGNDRSKWVTNVPNYRKVRASGIYPGIDLVYYGDGRKLEYDFVVHPGADPSHIHLAYEGADNLKTDAEGNLLIATRLGTLVQHKPKVYQEINGERREVQASYSIRAGKIEFAVANWDRGRELVIDPVLVYSTYFGGSGMDWGTGIAVDGSGNAYVTGYTSSIDFPTASGAHKAANTAAPDVFVAKLNPSVSGAGSLVYSTYLGGSGMDRGTGITVDGSGNSYLTGHTGSSNFPTTSSACQTGLGGGQDAFITKLDRSGSALIYSTYLGGSGAEQAYGIALDGSGNVYVTGETQSNNFPATSEAYRNSAGGGSDVFVAKLNPALAGRAGLAYSTYLGGTGVDRGTALAVDRGGNAYVMGYTRSAGFPTTAGAYQKSLSGQQDAFVAMLNPSGGSLVYSTFLGGSGLESGSGIALDGTGNAYVTGHTQSADFATTAGAYQTSLRGPQDAFLATLNPNGSVLLYSTFLGGSSAESGTAIAVDADGSIYVTGGTQSIDFPLSTGSYQSSLGGSKDAFMAKLKPAGIGSVDLLYSTYLGGRDIDTGYGIALDPNRNRIYLAGHTNSDNFPTTVTAYQTSLASGSGHDAFLAVLDMDTATSQSAGGKSMRQQIMQPAQAVRVDLTSSLNPSALGQSVTFTATLDAPATGMIAFQDNGTTILTCSRVTISSRTATCTTSAVKAGSRTITAIYSGDANYSSATGTLSPNQQVDGGSPAEVAPPASAPFSAAAVAPRVDPGTIRDLAGFRTNSLIRQDDSPSIRTNIGFTINLWGTNYSQVYVNNNGNVTFDGALSTYTPFGLLSTSVRIIAPFFGDVDTRNTASGLTYFGTDTVGGRAAFGVLWDSVGYYNSSADKLNRFELVIIDRSDTGPGNFDVEFNYGQIQWETGTASGGTNGLGGSSARAGFSNGSDVAEELAGSAVNGAFLDGGTNALIAGSNVGVPGRFLFMARAGAFIPPTLALYSSLNPSTSGQPVTFTMTVPSGATGTGTFRNNGTVINGCSSVTISGGAALCGPLADLAVGTHTITAEYSGDGTYEPGTTTLVQTVDKPFATVTVSSSTNPSTYGQAVTFTATVTPVAGVSGIVDFTDGTTVLCSAVTLSNGTASCGPLTNLTVGSHLITADFTADPTSTHRGAVSNPLAQIVNKANSTVTLTSSQNPSIFGQSVTFTATVTPAAATGTVIFQDGSTVLCSAAPLSGGTAICGPLTNLAAGSHPITAAYSGDANFNTSISATVTQTVNKANSTVSLTSSQNPSTFGQAVTFTAAVTPSSATGTFAFLESGAALLGCGAVPIAGGTATCTTSTLSVGTHTITAVYSGDTNYNTATSSPLNQTVGLAPTTTVLTATPGTVIYGETSLLKATVSNGAATGTVTFTATPSGGGSPITLGSASLDSTGTAVFPETTLAVGTYNVVVQYNGDPNFLPNTSNTVSLTVTQRTGPGGTPALMVVIANATRNASAPNPAFTYAVTGQLVPGDTYGTAVTGTADFSSVFTGPTPGVYPISLTGLASANYLLGFVNGALTVVADGSALATSTTLAANPSRAEYGTPVTLTATVTPVGSTGTVTFFEGSTLLGTANVSGLEATLPATLNAGTHNIRAQYNGDQTHSSSVSPPVTVIIDKKGTSNPANGLTVAAQNTSRVFGAANPAFSFIVTGPLVPGNTYPMAVIGVPVYSVNDTPASPVGSTFPITITGGLASANYVLTFVPGTLTIAGSDSTTTLTASAGTITFGQTEVLTATVAPAGATGQVVFQNGATVLGTATVTGGVAALTTSSLAVGTYTINATYLGDATYGASTSAPVTVIVNQAAALTVTVNDVSRPFGHGNPAFSYTVTGTLIDGDTYATAVRGVPAFTTEAVTNSPAGTYPISITGGLFSNNYALVFVPGTLTVLPATANRLAFVQQPSDAAAGATIAPAVTVQLADSAGNPVRTSGIAISLRTTTGATLSGTLVQNTDANGRATFADLSIAQAGTHGLQASASSTASAISHPFTISAGPAAAIVASGGTPQSAIVQTVFGSPLVAVVTDAARNPVSGVAVTFTAPGSGAGGTFGGQSAIVATTNVQGQASAVLTANNIAGSFTATASASGISGTAQFDLTNLPAGRDRLVFVQQPVTTVVGQVIAPAVAVQLQDAAGNPVATAGVPIIILLLSGTGTLSGTRVQLTDSGGTATFNDLSISQAGIKQLSAASLGRVPAVSVSFSITAGNAANIVVFSGSPQLTTVSTQFQTRLQARVTDSFGDPMMGAQVSFVINTGSSGASGTFGGPATAATDTNGIATAPVLTANSQAGAFTVTATTPGVSSQAIFTLGNLPAPSAGIQVDPRILNFRSETGKPAPPAQTVQITTGGSWTGASQASWITISPASGTGNTQMTVSVNPAGLALGTHVETVRVTDSAGNVALVLVTYTITAQPALVIAPASLVFTTDSASVAPPSQTLQTTSSSRTIAYTVSTRISTPVGGTWLRISTTQGQTPGTVSVSVNPAGLADGIYNGWVLFTPTESEINQVAAPVSLVVGCGQGGCGTQPIVIAVVNGASFRTAGAPGAIMTIFGTALSDAVYNATSSPLPTQLGPTTVTVNGTAVPLFYASPSQINFQMPSGVDLSNVNLVVNNQAMAGARALGGSPSYTTKLTSVDPGLFLTGNRAAALNQNLTPHIPSTPLAEGDFVVLFATGLGPVTPPLPDGTAAPPVPLSLIDASVQVTVGGQNAQVTYQGVAPGFAGLAQLNVIVPAGLMPGDQPVFVTINGTPSNAGVITVK